MAQVYLNKATGKARSRRYGGRFASPDSKWKTGHRKNPARKRRMKKTRLQTIIK